MRFPFTILSDRTRHLALMLLLLAGLAIESPVHARGVSPYLPMNMAPEIERDIERVLILADQAVTRRPFAAAAVLDALPHACRIDISLCRRVREYLNGYMRTAGLNHAGVEGGSSDVSSAGRPNQRGMFQGDDWSASVQAYWQPGDFFLVQLGGMAYPGEATPAGSWVSVGSEYVQLDIGYREHWWSPMTDSSMLVSTNAQPMPGVTLSNYTPISRLGVRYEIFAARMSRVDDIYYQGGQATGNPRLAGLHVSIEPVPGWSLSASRLLQFGGGPRGASFRDFLRAFLKPTKYDNISDELSRDEQFGNQIAAFSTRMVFPGATPFSVYFEYAGEDGSRLEGWRLGNAALSAGIDIPYLWNRFDFTYEISDWQNGWYVNNVYPQGTSNHGRVIGHWGADARVLLDAIGAQSHMVRLGWAPAFGGLFDLRYRTLKNEDYSQFDYRRQHELSLAYSRTWNEFTAGVEVAAGVDVFDEEFARVSGFLRFAPGQRAASSARMIDADIASRAARLTSVFVDAGVNASELTFDPSDGGLTRRYEASTTGLHAAMGVRRRMTSKSDLGVRVEFDEVDGLSLIGVRALDYRWRFGKHLALSVFAGAARYDAATAAYGYYGGLGLQWRDIAPGLHLSLDVRASDKIARDQLLPDDPQSAWGDMIYQIYGATLYLSYDF